MSQTVIFDADFSNNGDGFPDHTSSSPPASGPASVGPFGTAPNAWTLSYTSTPLTDGTANSFKVVSGELQSDDWGGQGIFTSQTIDVSGVSTVDISATGVNSGANDDDFTYFYILDGGSRVETVIGVTNNGDPINYSIMGLDVSGATTLEVGFEFSENGSGDGYDVSEFTVTDTGGGGATTSVQFTSTSASVLESVGTVDLTLAITDEDGSNATTCDVVIISGDAADVDSYTTQMVTFPAGSSANQTVTITVTDDSIFEGDETISFEIQNVAGGNSAAAGTDDQFDLTIEDNDPDPSITIFIEDFDGTFPNWSNDIESQLFVDPTTPSEGLFIQAASSNNANFSGNTAFGRDLDGESGEPSLSPYTFTFSSVDVSDYTSIMVSFDYHAFANAETGDYEIVIDGVGQGSVEYFNDPDTSPGVNGTITIPVANGTSTVGLILTGTLNGGSDVIEFDNFKITGIFSGLTYSGGSWSPSAPDGSTGASDAIIVDGTAVFAADASLNDVSVYPGAALQVDTAVTLTASSVTLESESDSYSSLILDGTITGTVNYNRSVNSFTDDATNNDNDLISAPLTGQAFSLFDGANTNLLASTTVTTLRAFATFNNDTGAYDNFDTTTNAGTTLDAATGYRTATTDGGTLTFTGTVNTGDVDKNITIGTDATFSEWNLIGNPYPSYVDIQAFLEHEVTTGITNFDLLEAGSGIYGYDGDASDGWTVITLANDDGEFFAPGQGFFVAANGTGTLIADHDIEFRASMRAAGTSDDFIIGRNSSPLTFLKLNASTIDKNYRTEFYFNENASQGLDQGYDAKLWGGSAPEFALYSHLVQNNTGLPMALQALSDTDYNDVIIPLGVNANAGEELTFSITENTLPSDINVYLEDNVTNTFTLLNDSDYIFTPLNSLNGTGRFYLRFSANVLSIDDSDLTDISIYNDGDRAIVIAGELLQPTTAKMYDLQGRVVMTKTLDITSREQRIETNQFSSGVYIIQLNNEIQSISQKIIIR
ncbi:T9SS type A sorting domain-containing protein [Winogradskyella tangerina]|uniref:T9SS type A sorting domain-containing protein n=1 Tax=Winogradskyella tangerina TaxID=2023240 RepID=UPI0018E526FC|nr:T9SS type A sorting domain-containing protein [Winogradskyella tangerina]